MAVPQAVERKGIGWEEYLNLPLTHYEIIDGEVNELATPILKHQDTVGTLIEKLRAHVRQRALGKVIPAPYDLVIRRQPLRTRQPDLFYLSYARAGDLNALLQEPRLEIAPDLVIEVLSPSDTYSAWREKLHDYHLLGVPEVWAVDLEREEVEVLTRTERGYSSLGWFKGGEPIQSQVLPDLQLTPKEVFAG